MPIVNGKYKNPGWIDNARPPISAQNLNDISDTLEKLDQGGGGTTGVTSFNNGWSETVYMSAHPRRNKCSSCLSYNQWESAHGKHHSVSLRCWNRTYYYQLH